jgi:hypothetical protein
LTQSFWSESVQHSRSGKCSDSELSFAHLTLNGPPLQARLTTPSLLVWRREVHLGGGPPLNHPNTSHAETSQPPSRFSRASHG